jgi:hypothetical protein
LTQHFQVLLTPANLPKPEKGTLNVYGVAHVDEKPSLDELFHQGIAEDPFPVKVLEKLRNGVYHTKEFSLAKCREENGLLSYCNCIYVPSHNRLHLQILQSHHDPPAVGPPRCVKTLELIDRM